MDRLVAYPWTKGRNRWAQGVNRWLGPGWAPSPGARLLREGARKWMRLPGAVPAGGGAILGAAGAAVSGAADQRTRNSAGA